MVRTTPAHQILGLALPVLVGIVVGIGLLEVAARLAWKDAWQDPLRDPPAEVGLKDITSVMKLAAPNVRGINRGVFYRSNNRGARSRNHSVVADEGVFRILVAGDSTTMGSGILEEHRFSDVLEKMLNEEDGRRYEFVNIGLSGLNTLQVANRLEKFLPYYNSHLIVYGFSVNDIYSPSSRAPADETRPSLDPVAFWAAISSAERSPSYLWRYLVAYRLGFFDRRGDSPEEIRRNYLDNQAAWANFVRGLDRLAAIAKKHGVCANVFILTHVVDLGEGHPYLEIYDRVSKAAIERGFSVTRTYSYFEGRDDQELWVSLFDPHPNREGHELFAAALRDGLEALPAECFERPRR